MQEMERRLRIHSAIITAILVKCKNLLARSRYKRKYDDDTAETRSTKKKYIVYNRDRAAKCLQEDFLGLERRFDNKQFVRTFRVTPSIAEDILRKLAVRDPIFTQRQQITGRAGIAPEVRLLCVFKCIGYGVLPTCEIPYFQMCESTICSSIKSFALLMIKEYSAYYLQQPTKEDAKRVLALYEEKHGVSGMFGSLDCMHVGWKNCPVAHQGQYSGKEKKPTLVLEAACDWNLWFWHVAFGYPGTLNDINIWDRSCLLRAFLSGECAKNIDVQFQLDDEFFNKLFFLGKFNTTVCCTHHVLYSYIYHFWFIVVDGKYPEIARFLKTISKPLTPIEHFFAAWQESARKDIERAFGVLQRKFHFLVHSIELWYADDINCVVLLCLILHNMMVEYRVECDEREAAWFYETVEPGDNDANDSLDREPGEDGSNDGSNADNASQEEEAGDSEAEHDGGSNANNGGCFDALEEEIKAKRANLDLQEWILFASCSASNDSGDDDDDLVKAYNKAKQLLLPIKVEVESFVRS